MDELITVISTEIQTVATPELEKAIALELAMPDPAPKSQEETNNEVA